MTPVLRALAFGCVIPSALVVAIVLGTRAWLSDYPYLAAEVAWLLYVVVPATMLLSAVVAVVWRRRSVTHQLALGSVIVVGVPGLITLGWLVAS